MRAILTMQKIQPLGALLLAIAGGALCAPLLAATLTAEAITVALNAPAQATPGTATIRQSADQLFECPPLNIDPKAMSCVETEFSFETLARVPFDHDKAAVNGQAVRSLDAAAIYLLLNLENVHRVYINGHADSTGTDTYNDRLAEKRAMAVRKYLVDRGISGERLAMGSAGERHPVDEHWTVEGRTNNRNVSLYVIMRRPAR